MRRRWVEALPDKPGWEWTVIDRILDRLGFEREIEYELVKDMGRATWDIPAWAPAGGDVIGVWASARARLVFCGLPISWWRDARHRGEK